MGKFSSSWALLLLIPCVLAGPLQPNSCASECRSPSNPKFRYAVGQTYVHNFQASSKTWMMGTSEDKATLDVKGTALITFRAPCDAVIQLRQTSIGGLDEKVDASELEKRPMAFSWQDGTVDSVCADKDDAAWVVNIKRAILSMMQHTAQFVDVSESHVIESDVIGRCPTQYTVEGSGKSVKVIKTKLPNQCSQRTGRHSSIPTVAYNVPAETQTIPLMNSTTVCQQQIKDGLVQGTECRETHLFRPLSTEQGGARTEVTSAISLVSTAPSGAAVKLSSNLVSSSLILDPRGAQPEFQDAKDVQSVVRALCDHLAADSPARVSHIFTELVHALRKASPKEVKAAYGTVRSLKTCPESAKTEKLFLDALPQAGSTGAITLMVDILKDNKVSSRQAMGWYLSMPLSKVVDLDAVKAVVSLVEKASNSPVALLGLTGLARRYCMDNMEECQSNPDVLQLSSKVAKLLGNRCQVDSKDEVRVISALKALGNLGVMTPEVRNTVVECSKDSYLPITVRLAAIEATRNSQCIKPVKENLLTILEDRKEDAEIRIAAYRAVMRCACSQVMIRVQSLLSTEEFNQVGSYITSHLNNIKSNPTPGKENLRRLVKKLILDRSFPSDLRKYSRHLAVADFCPINNAGWDVDASVIYNPKSFIPRSASANLTIDLFGQSINLLEVGVRAENLERLLEAYLGPDGVVEKEGLSGFLEKTGDSVSKFGDNVWNRISSRSKRANIKTNELTNLDKVVAMKDKPTNLKLDAFLRVFGSEVSMLSYRGASSGQQKLDLLEGMQTKIAEALRDLIEGAKRVDIDVARSLMFLDTSVTFPTVAGFPLRLSVNGTTTVGVGLESQMDLPALFRDPMNTNLKLKVSPLAVTELSASMTVDIDVAKTGIKMAATVHSSMAADFSARMQQGSAVEVKLDLPKSKMTLIDFSSKVVLLQQSGNKAERTKPMKINNEVTYKRGGCSERLTHITGMRLCATSSVSIPRPASEPSRDPVPAFPLSGSGSFAIVLEKSEPTMKGYVLSATTKQEGPKATSFTMTLDTPGSKTDRKVSVKGLLTSAPTLSAKLESKAPWGNLGVEAELVNRDELKSIQLKMITQEKAEYFGKAQLSVAKADRKYTVAGIVEAGWPQQPRTIVLEGGFAHAIGQSVEVSFKPAGPYANLPLGFQATVAREISSNVVKFSLSNVMLVTPMGRTLLSTEIGRQDRSYHASLNMKYGTEQSKMNAVAFNAQVQSLPSQADSKAYKTVVIYKSSRFPRMNVDLKWDIQKSSTLCSNTLVLVHGQESEQSSNRLFINQYSQHKGHYATKDYVLENKIEVTYPRFALNMKMDQSLKVDERNAKGSLILQDSNVKLVDGDLALVFAPKDPKNIYELAAKLAYPGRSIVLTDTGKRIDRNSLSVSPVLNIQPGRKIELNGKASLIKDQNGMSVNLDSELRVGGVDSPIKLRHSFQYTGEMTMTTTNKVEWDGQTQLVADGKVFLRTPTVPAVEVALLWNGRVEGRMDARLSKDESKMDVDIKLLRLQRRIKINSQHRQLADNRSGAVTVAWDADKDPSKQIGLEGSLTLSVPQRLVDLKTSLNVENRLYSMAVNGKLGAEYLNGDHAARVELQLPNTKKSMISLALSNVHQQRRVANKLEVESNLPSGSVYQMTLNSVVNDLDRVAHTFAAVTELTVKGTHVDEIKMRVETKRAVKNEKCNFEVKSLVIAPKWGQNIDTSASVEVNSGMFRAGSKYQRGPMLITVESAGKINRQGGKTNVDGFLEIKAPKTSWQQSKIAILSSYDITSISHFDISEKLSIVYQNSKTITLDTKLKVSQSTLDLNMMLETPYQVARRQGLTLSARFEPNNPRSEGSLVVSWSSPQQRQPQEARVDVEMERRPSQLRFKLTSSSPIKNLESSELSFDVRSLDDNKVHEIDIVAGLSERKTKLNGRLQLNPSQRELDVTLTLPSSNPLRFLARVGAQAPVYTIETRVDWGTGTLIVEGTTKYISSDNLEVQLKINSPQLGVLDYEVKGVNKVQNKQRTVEFTVRKKSSAVASVKSVYERKESRGGVQISGSAQVSVTEAELSGSIKYAAEARVVDASNEKGVVYKLEVDVTSGNLILNKVHGNLKMTTKEKSGSISLCATAGNCHEGAVGYKDTAAKATDVAKEAYALIKTTEDGVQQVQGLRAKHFSNAAKFEQSVEVLFDEAKNRLVGYKAYRKESEYGLEVYTPKRMSAATFEIITIKGSGRQPGKAQYIVTVWMDKTKAPERKLIVATTVEPHRLGDMDGAILTTLIKHPLLPKELEYRLEVHGMTSKSNSQDIFHMKLDADVLDAKHQRWTLETRVKNQLASSEGRNVTVEVVVRSKGADVSAALVLHGGVAADHTYSAGANLKLKEKERVDKELFFNLKATRQSAAVTLGSPVKQTTVEGRWSVDQVVNYPRLQLSGSTRVFGLSPTVYVLDVNASPHVDLRVFNKATPENYHQVVGGLLDDSRFELAVIRQLSVQKKELAAVYVSLNSTDLLTTRVTWKVDDLRTLVQAARTRSQAVSGELDDVHQSLANDLNTILQKWHSLGNLKAGYEKLARDFAKQLEQMKQEVESDESLREAVDMVEGVVMGMRYISEILEFLLEEWEGKSEFGETFEKVVHVISQHVTQYARAASDATSRIIQYILHSLEQWKNNQTDSIVRVFRNFYYSNEIQQLIAKISSSVDGRVRKLVAWIDSFNLGDRSILVTLKEAIKNANADVIRQRIASFVDEAILLPIEDSLNELTSKYPETTRPAWRYGKQPIRKIRNYLKESRWTSEESQVSQTIKSATVEESKSLISRLIGEIVVYDIQKGEIRYQLPLHRKITTLRDLWKLFDLHSSPMKGLAISSSLRDLYRDMRSKYDPTLASTRLNGYASLIGSKGLVTFDKKSYDLSGGCQYLLARDFLNQDFAVAVNFEQPSTTGDRTKKSVIFTDGADQVEIKDDQVLINNKPATNLPVELKTITVHRHGDLVTVKRSSGAVLRCDVRNDVCTMELSPFYAGRTMGLWGTFTNEHADDLSEPTGKVSKDVASFAASWKINKSCKDNIQTVSESSRTLESIPGAEQCSSLFVDEDSDLRSCFRAVSPHPYQDLCLKFVHKGKKTGSIQNQLDSLITGYRAACQRSGVSL